MLDADVAARVDLGRRIADGRALASLTQAELADRAAIERTALAKIESGSRKLSATELVRLADALDRSADWFFSPSPAAVVSRRADPAVGGRSPALDSRVERIARDVSALVDAGDIAADLGPSVSFETPSSLEEAEESARHARVALGADGGPLLELQAAAERVGMLAFSLDLGRSGGDAAYVSLSERLGVAVVNGAMEPGRRRFNLAHELGHHLFGDAYAPEVGLSPQDETERMVNAFAIHLLLPRDAVLDVWGDMGSSPRLAAIALAVRFRVSWTAVCAQLRNLRLIDPGQQEELAARPPGRADFVELGEQWVPELAAPSVPPQFGRRILSGYRRGKLSRARTLELLWGTVADDELPAQDEIPLEAYRREFEPLT